MKNILVTGGAGFIGTNFVYYWLNKYPEDRIVVMDSLTYAGNRQNLFKADRFENFKFVQGDILDQDLVQRVLKKECVDTIVHFAAESHVDRSIHSPDQFINTNIVGTHSLLKAARKIWIDHGRTDHRFHHVSTDEVFGTLGPGDPAFTETTPYAPNSPYAASKASSDHLVRVYYETYGLDITISNCSNNYGPFQFPEKLIPLVIVNILDGRSLPVYGDGKQIRDWLYVDDHNLGVDLILKSGRSGQTYNIGGNNERANIDIVRLLCKMIDKKFEQNKSLARKYPDSPCAKGKNPETLITHVQDRAGHDRRYAINAGKISSELGYVLQENFESGIQKTLNWYLENEQWWRKIMDKTYLDWVKCNYNTDG